MTGQSRPQRRLALIGESLSARPAAGLFEGLLGDVDYRAIVERALRSFSAHVLAIGRAP